MSSSKHKNEDDREGNSRSIELRIEGMTCAHCASSIEKRLEQNEGVLEQEVSYPQGKGRFVIDPEKTSKKELIEAIDAMPNYSVVGEETGRDEERPATEDKEEPKRGDHPYELIIIGGGSAAFSAASSANELGKKALLVNSGLPMGGTCVNVGCIPSKNLIRAGESVHNASTSPFPGIKPHPPEVDFGAVIRQKQELVAEMQKKKYLDVAEGLEGVTFLEGRAKFRDENTIMVNGRTYSAPNFLIATGAGTKVPPIDGLEDVGYHTHASLFDLEERPDSLTIMGAGYIGLEIAMAYKRLGVKVRLLEYTDRVLRTETPDISEELEKHLEGEGIELYPNFRIDSVEKDGDSTRIEGMDPDGETFSLDEPGHIVVATGIGPNTEDLGLDRIGVELGERCFIKVDEGMRTSSPHVYAAGDCADTPAFVYTAAKEGKVAARNALAGENDKVDYKGLPWVVFTDPQVAGAGMDEQEAEAEGIPYETSVLPLSEVPRSAAARDTRGFIKLIRNPESDKLLGARIVAPEGGELVMQASLAIKYGIPVSELAEAFHPYLTLSEGIKLAAITFEKDVAELSCCAT